MPQRGRDRIAEIRRKGRRIQAGPWVLVISPCPGASGRLIAALGRKAGPAVARSRARRIARECFSAWQTRQHGMDVLLMARADVSNTARRQIRRDLARLLERGEPSWGQA